MEWSFSLFFPPFFLQRREKKIQFHTPAQQIEYRMDVVYFFIYFLHRLRCQILSWKMNMNFFIDLAGIKRSVTQDGHQVLYKDDDDDAILVRIWRWMVMTRL